MSGESFSIAIHSRSWWSTEWYYQDIMINNLHPQNSFHYTLMVLKILKPLSAVLISTPGSWWCQWTSFISFWPCEWYCDKIKINKAETWYLHFYKLTDISQGRKYQKIVTSCFWELTLPTVLVAEVANQHFCTIDHF